MVKLVVSDSVDSAFDAYLSAILDDYARAQNAGSDTGFWQIEALDDHGNCVGGMVVEPIRGWLYVKYLALDSSTRGSGIGRKLLRECELLAQRLALVGVYLDTFDFEAPDFYAKNGYTEMARLPDVAGLPQKIWFYKLGTKEPAIHEK